MSTFLRSPIQDYLIELHRQFSGVHDGAVADYIPQLKSADPDAFGIALVTVDGHVYQVGDTQLPFTIQSMSKPFTYGMALERHGIEYVQQKVGMEPSGEAFNSISLDPGSGRPRNPMINAGAIASSGMIEGDGLDSRLQNILDAYERYVGSKLELDESVYKSESETGHRNRAIGHMLRNFDILEEDPEETLELYFKQCAISLNCRDLAMMAATLSNGGVNPITSVRALNEKYVEKVLSVMSSCGMYDYAGSWIYEVGLPAKSGVSGGILAILPGQLGLAIYSPRLDEKGNSFRGIQVCKQVSRDFDLHMLNSRSLTASVIRAQYDANAVRSKRVWPTEIRAKLDEQGASIKVWELHGDLVFGSTEFVLANIMASLNDTSHVILDLKRVFNINPAASRLLTDLALKIQHADKVLLFTNCDGNNRFLRYLRRTVSAEIYQALLRCDDKDSALEFCEDQLIQNLSLQAADNAYYDLEQQDLCANLLPHEFEELRGMTAVDQFKAGEIIIQEGASADCLYFLASGYVSVNLKTSHTRYQRLATISAGMTFGEIAMIDSATRSATVIAEVDVECIRLDAQALNMETPIRQALKSKLLASLALDLARKLRAANTEIRSVG